LSYFISHQTTSFTIRLATSQDLDSIVESEKQAYHFPWSKKLLQSCLQEQYTVLIMENEVQVIGHMIFQKVLDEIHLHNVCIIPKNQAKGLGHQWLKHLNNYALKHKIKSIILEVRISNEAAKNLYLQHNYREIGLRKKYYKNGNQSEDALVMKAILD